MVRIGYADQQEEIIKKLSEEGIPDYRSAMQEEVDKCMADPHAWVHLGYAAFLDRLDEARKHNQVVRDERDAEREVQKMRCEQEEQERLAESEKKFQDTLNKAEMALLNHQRLVDDKGLRGTSLFLHLFRRHCIAVPLKTQGWIKSALVSVDYNQAQENWVYQYYSSHRPSATFSIQLQQLVNSIRRKYEMAVDAPKGEESALPDDEDEWDR